MPSSLLEPSAGAGAVGSSGGTGGSSAGGSGSKPRGGGRSLADLAVGDVAPSRPWVPRGNSAAYAKAAEDRARGGGAGGKGGKGGKGGRKKISAPRTFGTNDHGAGLDADEDYGEGKRVDEEGMVYDIDDGASGVYFCDRNRRYKMDTGAGGLALLQSLVACNTMMLEHNSKLLSSDSRTRAAQLRQGYTLYDEKPNFRRKGGVGTWSDEEYGLPGFQWMYLRMKSFQRFTETWAMLERLAIAGLFEPGEILLPARPPAAGGGAAAAAPPLRVVSLGGGPGYELLAYEWFCEYWAECGPVVATGAGAGAGAQGSSSRPSSAAARSAWLRKRFGSEGGVLPVAAPAAGGGGGGGGEEEKKAAAARHWTRQNMELVSLDLQPTWRVYAEALGYGFDQWDIHKDGAAPVLGPDVAPPPTICMISNVLCYCTDQETADFLAGLLSSGVRAILVNERGAEQRICSMLEARGVVVHKLLDQVSTGRDDRQMIFLPPGSPALRNSPLPLDAWVVFPNQPYEERKAVVRQEAAAPLEMVSAAASSSSSAGSAGAQAGNDEDAWGGGRRNDYDDGAGDSGGGGFLGASAEDAW